MDPQKPGFPTSPYYPPASTSTGTSQATNTTTKQPGVYRVAGTTVTATIARQSHPAGTDKTPEQPPRKVVKAKPASTPAFTTYTVGDLYNFIKATQNAAAWTLQQLRSGPTGFSSTLVPVSYQMPDWLEKMLSPPTERKRAAPDRLDDAIAPAGETLKKSRITGTKTTSFQPEQAADDYQKEFETRAIELIRMFPENPIDANKLWNLSDSPPSVAATKYLGSETFAHLPSKTRIWLCDCFINARVLKNKAQNNGIESLPGIDTKASHAPSPVPSSIISEQSTDTGYSTATSGQSLPPTFVDSKAAFSFPPARPVAPKNSTVRAVLTNPHKNRCFMNATIHYLKAVLPLEEQTRLINLVHLPETELVKFDPVVIAFARLYQAMEQFEGGITGSDQAVVEALNALVPVCLASPVFKHCVSLKDQRKTRAATLSSMTPDQQLQQLDHNDAAEFYMAIWRQLRHLIPSMNQTSLYQEMQTIYQGHVFTKRTQINTRDKDNDGCEPFIPIKFEEDTDLQTAINNFFATSNPGPGDPDHQIDWDSHSPTTPSGISLPKGRYLTSKACCLGTQGFLKNLHLRFELQTLAKGTRQKMPAVCNELRKAIFNDINVPVNDIDSGISHSVRATPVCIIAHCGDDLNSGHYVTLEKTEHGWLCHDDGKPVVILDNPALYLQSAPYFDPYLVAYEVI